MIEPAVQCHDLTKFFGDVPAVHGVSLMVEEGSLMALVGPSGCGKTTTLRLIAGFEAPDSGTVAIRGRIVSSPANSVAPERRRVGMVFQDYALFPHLTVRANVGFGLSRGQDRTGRVDALLELVGLAGISSRLPHALSGGEQQRVALARALAPNPAVVLMDEPFSNLDASLRAKVRSEVKRILKDTGTTAVFVTHDQDEALSLADQVGVMLAGHVVQVGTPEEIYAGPASLAVAAFVGDANLLSGVAAGTKVDTAIGVLRTTGAASGSVKVLVRPEALHLRRAGPGEPSVEVVDREFYGHDQVIRMRLPSGLLLRARCGPDQTVEPGDLVTVSVPTAVPVFPAEE
jgi:iron(III) transport system ATP-binding protein